jgi:DNA-binding MarR family transcriptional regulator
LLRRSVSRIATPGNGRGEKRQAAQAFAWRRQSHKIAAPHRLAQCRVAKSKTVVPEDPTAVSALIELLELAGRSMHSIGYADGLYPAQWTALRYFSKASDGARTASALARFPGFANGPVSRTVRTLISKGLLRKAESQPAGRAEYLEITENARSLLEHDPARAIAETIATLPEDEKAALDHALRAVIKSASGVWPRDGKGNGKK